MMWQNIFVVATVGKETRICEVLTAAGCSESVAYPGTNKRHCDSSTAKYRDKELKYPLV
jgi:hypothetical protein